MPINASIAVLAANSALARSVANQISGQQRFSVPTQFNTNDADSAVTFGESVTLTAIPADPELFDPHRLGSFLAWGADIALLVVDSSAGIDGETIQRAQEVAQHHPLMAAVTGLNSPRANFDESLAVISRVMGQGHHVVAITLPVLQELDIKNDSDVAGILDLVDLQIRVPGPDGLLNSHELEQAHYDLIESHIEALTNAVVVTSTDENLIHSVLKHGFESVDQLRGELLSATSRREVIPVFALADSIGVTELASFVCELNLKPWTPKHTAVGIFLGTTIGSNLIRIWQGELKVGTYFADGTEIDITHIHTIEGSAKKTAKAGDIVKIKTQGELLPGRTVSDAKSSPLAVDHAFE